jgi:hypothetical protein
VIRGRATSFAALLALSLAATPAARAQSGADSTRARAADSTRAAAPADTALGGFLQDLRDSTDRYFGRAVAPVDTAGLDSLLAVALVHPERMGRGGGLRRNLTYGPWFSFSRVDGPIYGGEAGIGRRRHLGRLTGKAGYAVGSDTWLGSGGGEWARRHGDLDAILEVEAGRLPGNMDRDRVDVVLPAINALFAGADTRRYLRHDGLEARFLLEHASWRARVAYRDMLESPLPVTARWDIFGYDLKVSGNLPAQLAHTHELSYHLASRTPWVPMTAQAEYWTGSHKLGGDLEYRRTRLAVGGDFGVHRWLAVIPQLVWGRQSGDPVPQEALYLGGLTTLRSLDGNSLGGTGLAIGRLEVLEMPDLLEVLGIPHPSMLPIQAGAFVASGAVWGTDPYGGPTVPGVNWPHSDAFHSEVGVSLLYRPGLPDPSSYLQTSWAWPVGQHHGGPVLSLSYTRGIDLVRTFRTGEP